VLKTCTAVAKLLARLLIAGEIKGKVPEKEGYSGPTIWG
jgi:hypothetical protein